MSNDDMTEYANRLVSVMESSVGRGSNTEIFRNLWEILHSGYYEDVHPGIRKCIEQVSMSHLEDAITTGGLDVQYLCELRRRIIGQVEPTYSIPEETPHSRNMEQFRNISGNISFLQGIAYVTDMSKFMIEFAGKSPCIFPGACSFWNACSKWTRKGFWEEALENRFIPLEVGIYSDDLFEIRLVTASEFVPHMDADLSPDYRRKAYLAQADLVAEFPSLIRDISPTPDFVSLLGRTSKYSLFMGPQGTFTPWHNDPYDNILCQVVGVKHVSLRFWNVDLETSAELQCEISAGDCIYIPAGCWHSVKSLCPSISVAHFISV